ncbi:unnamed protein product [Lactuca virosa]|uniref:Uncharacterized protein n=1 Tax=Lactuca virosa TaxID=75947 RepID=A0AAU9LPJ0_9ASTR|nr:unnamed protein product [Lactuca virosa]
MTSKRFWLRLPRKGTKGPRELPRNILRKKELMRLRNLRLRSERLLLPLLLHQSEGSNPLEGESLLLLLHLRVKTQIRILIPSRRFALRRIPLFTMKKMNPFTLNNKNTFVMRKKNKFALRPRFLIVRECMEAYQVTYNANTTTTNKAIQNVGAMFQAEKANFAELCTVFKSDHEALQNSIDAKLTKLQEELAMEKKDHGCSRGQGGKV